MDHLREQWREAASKDDSAGVVVPEGYTVRVFRNRVWKGYATAWEWSWMVGKLDERGVNQHIEGDGMLPTKADAIRGATEWVKENL